MRAARGHGRRSGTTDGRFSSASVNGLASGGADGLLIANCGLMHRSKTTPLFDHLVGAREHCRRHVEAECPRGDQVYDEIELGRLLDRNIGGLRAPQNFVHIIASTPKHAGDIGTIGHESAGFDEIPITNHRRKPRALRQSVDVKPVDENERIGTHIQGLRAAVELLESGRDILPAPDFERKDLISRNSSSRLPTVSGSRVARPVTLPPGLAKLATTPAETPAGRAEVPLFGGRLMPSAGIPLRPSFVRSIHARIARPRPF